MLPELHTAIPGPRSRELARRLGACESRNVTWISEDFPVFWDRAQGSNVWDVDGNRLVDFTSAFGVSGLGHSNPKVVAALAKQADRLIHGMGDVHPTALKVELCERLAELTFGHWKAGPARTLLGNTGFEAVEAALKTALLATGKPGVLTFENAYHGLGYGTLAAGSMARFRTPFQSQLADFGVVLPFPRCHGHCDWPVAEAGCPDECRAQLDGLAGRLEEVLAPGGARVDIGAVLVEPILGRGGKVTPPPGFLPLLRKACDRHGVVLIFDEILTGLNRCGARFACDLSGTVPDLVCLGKALSSGLPLSACVGRAEVMDAWPRSDGEAIHTTTHLGNPLACAMALAALDQHADPGLPARVAERGRSLADRFRDRLHTSPRFGAIRGAGLLRGVEIVDPRDGRPDGAAAGGFVTHALARGFIVLADSPDGNIVSLVPPFDIADDEVDALATTLQEYLGSLPGSIS